MPELTEEQIKLAKERVRNEIDFSFSEKVTGTPKTVYKTTNITNTGDRKKTEEKDPDNNLKENYIVGSSKMVHLINRLMIS